MAVFPFVLELVQRLQRVVANEMLDLQNREYHEQRGKRTGHVNTPKKPCPSVDRRRRVCPFDPLADVTWITSTGVIST